MIPGETDRRDLFRSVFGEWLERLVAETERKFVQQRYVRPPGALPELAFLAACTRCGACAPACPVRAILTVPSAGGLAAGTPYLEPERQPTCPAPERVRPMRSRFPPAGGRATG
jgi:ferredoxin